MNHAEIADTYRRHLPAGRLAHFRVDGLDRLGVPVVTARLALPDGRAFEGIGYGATGDEALVGALGELTEEVHCERALAAMPRVEASRAELVARHGERAVADPAALGLPAGSAWTERTPLVWVRAERIASGEPVLVPEAFACDAVAQLRDRTAALVTPITNGLGAGLSRETALAHGLLELLQRDGNVLAYRALDQGIAIDLDAARDPALVALVERYRAQGVEVVPKLASTEFGLANVYVVGAESTPLGELPLRLTACGEAAHPDRERALRKALLEFAGSRARKSFRHGPLDRVAAVAPPGYLDAALPGIDPHAEEPRALERMIEWLEADEAWLRGLLTARGVLAVRATRALSSLPTVEPGAADDAAARLAIVVERLAAAGLEPLCIDFSPPGGQVHAYRTIVPGLECETMSYHRIGERGVRRLLERGSPWVAVGTRRPGFARVVLEPAAEARLGGPAWLDTAAIDAAVDRLYPLYREPGGHSAQLAMARRRAAA